MISKTKKTLFLTSAYLLIAAVILLAPLSRNDFARFGFDQAFAFFGNNDEEQALITEESLRAQFQGIKEKLLRDGSFIYSSGYHFPAQLNDFDESFGSVEFSGNILLQGIAFLSPSNPSLNFINGGGIFGRVRSGVITYEVQSGDTPSYIAASFGVSTNTLLWVNNLSYWSIIKPGQKLVILPTSGVLHEVKKGETLDKIVKNYKGDLEETIAYNGVPADGFIQVGQSLIVPNGKKPVYYSPQPKVRLASYYEGPYSDKSRRFPWGQCTWYVAQKRYVSWSGHAKYWLNNAAKLGYSVCWGRQCQPEVGSIISMAGNTWLIRLYGHVAYVEAVNGDWITFSEMNYLGLGIKSIRTIHRNDWRIRGYIY